MTESVFTRHFGHSVEDRVKGTGVERRSQLGGSWSSAGGR